MKSKILRRFFHSTLLFLLLGFFSLIIVNLPWQRVLAVSETRYMRSDTHTINSLSAYQLGTGATSSALNTTVACIVHPQNNNGTVYWGVRVWTRNSSGTETELTEGTPVAQVSRTSGSGVQSATWAPSATTLATTNSIIVRVYIRVVCSTEDTGWVQGGTLADFSTEQLGSIRLDNQTWTIYYNTTYYTLASPPSSRYTSGTFYWGASATEIGRAHV